MHKIISLSALKPRIKNIVSAINRYLVLFVTSLMLFALTACATQPKDVLHSFSFGSYSENQDIEVLNFQYGSTNMTGTRPEDWEFKREHIGQGTNVSGAFPVGDFLYVKWRIESTGAVYEDTVDLKSRLPPDMDHQTVYFVIKGSQLYVYLISEKLHAHGAPDCPSRPYHSFKCTTLYPEHQANF